MGCCGRVVVVSLRDNVTMRKSVVIAGGGIGGLAAALACADAHCTVELIERAPAFAEVGAGIQLGPNVVRILHGWGLEPALSQVAAYPQALVARNGISGAELGALPLGERTLARYGAPYLTIARADMHKLLLTTVQQQTDTQLRLDACLEDFEQDSNSVQVHLKGGDVLQADALIGADGLWSRVRTVLLGYEPPRVTGHLAYRAMVEQNSLPQPLRSQQVTVWMGPHSHVVQYPVRQGQWLNVVAIVHGKVSGRIEDWDHAANAADLRAALADHCAPVRNLVECIDDWRLWPLCDRPPMQAALEQAQGRVALLGDAAHPMRPYMAQGAGMAIEDASCLQQVLASTDVSMAQCLHHYAQQRWRRNARVQARSIRNGDIFHATGLVRWGRDLTLRFMGRQVMDVPWLYRGERYAPE
jgi:salicylate hydroxylase